MALEGAASQPCLPGLETPVLSRKTFMNEVTILGASGNEIKAVDRSRSTKNFDYRP
jgi:hypothetical protein